MRITGLNHITINVKNLELSEKFYEDILGLEKCGFIDMGDHTLTYYQLPQNVRLELIDYTEEKTVRSLQETDLGIYRHFCLETDSLEEVTKRCRAAGVPIRKAASRVEKLGCDTMLIVDPSGVEIELIQ